MMHNWAVQIGNGEDYWITLKRFSTKEKAKSAVEKYKASEKYPKYEKFPIRIVRFGRKRMIINEYLPSTIEIIIIIVGLIVVYVIGKIINWW